jgi:predicted  nucleic acid-binding Zn-ribbon protein
MKEEIVLREKINLLEKEIGTLTEQLEQMRSKLVEIDDLKDEMKGLKLFLGRTHPEFKSKFPEILQKVYTKS